ncbi:MAG: GNAT family N-acetyltransferase [Hyphomonas sp.]|nr:GNAT family N-acetyltransferase [Hyphomonas sp.]
MRRVLTLLGKWSFALIGAPPRAVDTLLNCSAQRHEMSAMKDIHTITFRDATQRDLHAIVALLADDILGSQREVLSDPLDQKYVEAFQDIEQQTGNRMLVALLGPDEVVGCLQLTITPGLARLGSRRATIEGVRVRSDQRSTGLGALMFAYAIEEARQAGCELVQLTTDKKRARAHRFYEHLGFKSTHVGMKLEL